jgi:hypothetical protein
MANRLRSFYYALIFGKEGETMMAMLWTQQIILGKKTYAQVPNKLREQVAELLTDSGCEDLIVE